ncbi:hypothetical protein GCM10010407_19150 [Rarobacter incanus]
MIVIRSFEKSIVKHSECHSGELVLDDWLKTSETKIARRRLEKHCDYTDIFECRDRSSRAAQHAYYSRGA